jgi:hypothetical protein
MIYEDGFMRYELRRILEEIIEPGGGDDEKVEIEDPNDPEEITKKNKSKYRPQAAGVEVYDSGSTKMWMPGGIK